ncbi:MAG: hypothetical protein RL385_6120 [Pseudomonadota bacterium]
MYEPCTSSVAFAAICVMSSLAHYACKALCERGELFAWHGIRAVLEAQCAHGFVLLRTRPWSRAGAGPEACHGGREGVLGAPNSLNPS